MSECPVSGNGDQCPVSGTPKNPNSTAPKYNEAISDYDYGQSPDAAQKSSLSTTRAVSSIPRSSYTPSHQPSGVDRWVYPSEQQYYLAMKKKGYDPKAMDMPVVLMIHNVVNEQGWSKIREWEALSGNNEPKLVRFMGRPRDLSPKALCMSFLGYSLPFDRHDWFIERKDGKQVRYVIDFYKGQGIGSGTSPLSVYLDVRPALDSLGSIFERISFSWRRNFRIGSMPKVPPSSGVVREKPGA